MSAIHHLEEYICKFQQLYFIRKFPVNNHHSLCEPKRLQIKWLFVAVIKLFAVLYLFTLL